MPRRFVARSRIESSSVKFRRIVPEPLPVLTVTVYVLGVTCDTLATDAPVTPLVLSVKSALFTPVTASLKVAVN